MNPNDATNRAFVMLDRVREDGFTPEKFVLGAKVYQELMVSKENPIGYDTLWGIPYVVDHRDPDCINIAIKM